MEDSTVSPPKTKKSKLHPLTLSITHAVFPQQLPLFLLSPFNSPLFQGTPPKKNKKEKKVVELAAKLELSPSSIKKRTKSKLTRRACQGKKQVAAALHLFSDPEHSMATYKNSVKAIFTKKYLNTKL